MFSSSFSLVYLFHLLANHRHSDPQKDYLGTRHATDKAVRPTYCTSQINKKEEHSLLDIEGTSGHPVVPVPQLAVLWTNHQASGGLVLSADTGGEEQRRKRRRIRRRAQQEKREGELGKEMWGEGWICSWGVKWISLSHTHHIKMRSQWVRCVCTEVME